MNVEGLEEATEPWKDFILDVAQRAADKVGGSHALLPRPRRWFIETYREANNGIELVLDVRIGEREPTYFVAVIVGTGVECGWSDLAEPTEAPDADNGDKQLMMLVADVEPMEDGKFVVRWLRSLVRLHLIEDFPQFLRDAGVDLGTGVAPAIGCGRHFEDREGRGIAGRPALGDDELPGEMVERDAEVVNGVADDRAQDGRHGGYVVEPKDVLRSLLIALSDNGLSTRCLDRPDVSLKVVQMGFRPVDLDGNAIERTRHEARA